ncbi:hypothetical protein HED42_09010 [Enterococcus casseliflavus]|uniref:hypothetical protein n=1 Tax=Enterococcus casseliflavus TaxID=37734 RepID=UPI0014332EE4|nr:hypothetical protein [Enterococcus casseliflavus]NKD38271.1 hypothetical protein [Enterococcus casseliflavus]
MSSYSVDIEIFAAGEPDGNKRLNLLKEPNSPHITFTAHNKDQQITFQVERKEALELASHLFRQILDLY